MLQDAPPARPDDDIATELDPQLSWRLDEIQREVLTQGDRTRTTARSFAIFAAFGLLISMVTLLAVAAKLQKKTDTPTATVTRTAPASAQPAPLPSAVNERLTEMKMTGSASTVAAGRVTFKVSNDGAVTHELVVLKTDTLAARLPTDANGRADETGNIGETGDMKAGATKTLAIRLTPGHYAVICNLPGHYKAGMYADLTVK